MTSDMLFPESSARTSLDGLGCDLQQMIARFPTVHTLALTSQACLLLVHSFLLRSQLRNSIFHRVNQIMIHQKERLITFCFD